MPEHAPTGTAPEQRAVALFEPATGLPPVPEDLWCPLDTRDLLCVDGADATSFLQGQLTQDMARLDEDRVLYAAHCSPKGRITALFRSWRMESGILLDLPPGMGAAAQKRLSMYLLRAKARVRDARSEWQRTGVAGPALSALLEAAGFPLPAEPGRLLRNGPRACLCLGEARWLAVNPPGDDGGLRQRLATFAQAQPQAWQLAALRAGEPEVLAATVDAFVPQMLNLDTLDGISFRKGCYTGQEIVARAHYLGRVKRRMRRFAWRGTAAPEPGSVLPISAHAAATGSVPEGPADAGEEASGRAQVVWALATGDDGGELLAVTAVADAPDAPTPRDGG